MNKEFTLKLRVRFLDWKGTDTPDDDMDTVQQLVDNYKTEAENLNAEVVEYTITEH